MAKVNTHGKITGIACLAALLVCSGCWFSSDEDRPKKAQPAPMDLKAEIQTASELVDWIKARNNQTQLQRKSGFGKFRGKMVAFRGEVREVGVTAFGGEPFVSLKVGRLDVLENINIQFNFKKSQISSVAKWKKGETHVLRGRIKDSGDVFDDTSCDNAEVVPEEKYLAVVGKKVGELNNKVRETSVEAATDKLKSSLDDMKNKLDNL